MFLLCVCVLGKASLVLLLFSEPLRNKENEHADFFPNDVFSPAVKTQILSITCRENRKTLKSDVQKGNERCGKDKKVANSRSENVPLVSVSCQDRNLLQVSVHVTVTSLHVPAAASLSRVPPHSLWLSSKHLPSLCSFHCILYTLVHILFEILKNLTSASWSHWGTGACAAMFFFYYSKLV